MKDKILYIAIIFIIIAGGVALYFIYGNKKIDDHNRFSEEYTLVGKDNIFVYTEVEEIIDILENKTGVVFLGFSDCKWCQYYVQYLNKVCKEENIEKIYYFDIKDDRESNSTNYQKIVSILSSNLDEDGDGNKRIFVPDVTFVKDGNIIGHNNETSTVTEGEPIDYWTQDKISRLEDEIRKYAKELNLDACTTCN